MDVLAAGSFQIFRPGLLNSMQNLIVRMKGKLTRSLASRLCRREIAVNLPSPIISFSFDDAPRSAFMAGGGILSAFGANATYYVSLGMLGLDTEVGKIASTDDLALAVSQDHELGCHTFDHYDAWFTAKAEYMDSVRKNKEAIDKLLPGLEFTTFAYPKSGATLPVKCELQKRFLCCRGGGQKANIGTADLNLLSAYFLDRRQNQGFEPIKQIIDYNALHKGWLIFATHDISDNPSPFGCSSELFQKTVEYSAKSGAILLTVSGACKKLVDLY